MDGAKIVLKGIDSMNLKQLEYVLKVVDCGSISEAAQQLFISQPGLSKAIQSLESEYGIHIFTRQHGGIALTSEGKDFVYYAHKVVSAAQMMDDVYASHIQKTYAHLSIALQQQYLSYDLLSRTFTEFPALKQHFHIMECNRYEVTERVLRGEAELGILVRSNCDGNTVLWNSNHTKLDIFVLDQSPAYICIGPQSPFYGQRQIDRKLACTVPNIFLGFGMAEASTMVLDYNFQPFNTDQAVFCNSLECCRDFLLHTNALAFLTKWDIGYMFPPLYCMEAYDTSNRPYLNELLLIKQKRNQLSSTERNFISLLAEHFGKDPDTVFAEK